MDFSYRARSGLGFNSWSVRAAISNSSLFQCVHSIFRHRRIKPTHLGLEGSPKELGSPTYPEFESIYEQDPVPNWGGSDEIFGVWGLDIEVAHVPRNKVVGMLLCGLGVFGLVGSAAYLVDAPSRKPAGPRTVY
jgi:hypothetical protein